MSFTIWGGGCGNNVMSNKDQHGKQGMGIWGNRDVGNLVLASWWESLALGLLSELLSEIQPSAKGNVAWVTCGFYLPEFPYRHWLHSSEPYSNETNRQSEDFFPLNYVSWTLCAPEMRKDIFKVSQNRCRVCQVLPSCIYWFRADARKGFSKE